MAHSIHVVQPLLTDFYQISMAYAYWKGGKHLDEATFDLFFRKNPFGGEFTLFGGLEDCLKFVEAYKFQQSDIDYLRDVMPDYIENEFFKYLLDMHMNDIRIYAVPEGSIVFPRVPLLRVEGPIIKVQLLETTLLTLINFASLVATNAARFVSTADSNKRFLEFGLRRAQGPDGGLTASKYCYLGGFYGTSNVLAGKLYGIPVIGTHAHAYVSSFSSVDELTVRHLIDPKSGESHAFVDMCLRYLEEVCSELHILSDQTKSGELAAFISYAISFPSNCLALVDTYDVLKSGIPNFLAVALALHECNYKAKGVRLDSGDLAYLSKKVREVFLIIAGKYQIEYFKFFNIVASNDINEDTLISLGQQGHSIDTFGIGTHLVTCQKQPALGCVYKLVELNGTARMKISHDNEKVTIPGRKNLFRLYDNEGIALCDLMSGSSEPAPQAERRILTQHPFIASKRAYVTPKSVKSMYKLYWQDGKIQETLPIWKDVREYAKNEIATLRSDYRRDLNPTPYKISVTETLYQFLHKHWLDNVPIGEIS